MQWIKSAALGHYMGFFAVQADRRLSSELSSPGEIDEHVKYLKQQLDQAAVEMKAELQKLQKLPLFPRGG